MRKHRVIFSSPGTFVHEQTGRAIDSWDPKVAARMAKKISERYGAKPFCFHFTTVLSGDPVSDGEGGTLEVQSKVVERSGRFFLTGTVRTVAEVKAKADPDESILLSNMEYNNWNALVENTNSFKSTQPFEADDVIIDWDGEILARGSDYA